MDPDHLKELYQEILLGHSRNPRNDEPLDPCTHTATGVNPLCGDKLTVYANKTEETVEEVSCHCEGCAICRASGSMMTQLTSGKSEAEIATITEEVKAMLTAEEEPQADIDSKGELAALLGVRKFPARIKCATLPWHALESALKGGSEATTE